jgi:hypothetical protein
MTHELHLTAAVTHEGEWYVARCLQVEVTSQAKLSRKRWTTSRRHLSSTSRTLPLLRSAK